MEYIIPVLIICSTIKEYFKYNSENVFKVFIISFSMFFAFSICINYFYQTIKPTSVITEPVLSSLKSLAFNLSLSDAPFILLGLIILYVVKIIIEKIK